LVWRCSSLQGVDIAIFKYPFGPEGDLDGTTWFGEQRLFGPGVSYQQADRTLAFVKTPTGYSVHTIQLVRQVNGNLPTSALSASRW
jgi:hypothetical protein